MSAELVQPTIDLAAQKKYSIDATPYLPGDDSPMLEHSEFYIGHQFYKKKWDSFHYGV